MESRIVSLLRENPAVSNIVESRIYPLVIPKSSKKPAIVFTPISHNRTKIYVGVLALKRARMQISCWAKTFTEAKQLSIAVDDVLDAFSGVVNNMEIKAIWQESQIATYDENSSTYVFHLDFSIHFKE